MQAHPQRRQCINTLLESLESNTHDNYMDMSAELALQQGQTLYEGMMFAVGIALCRSIQLHRRQLHYSCQQHAWACTAGKAPHMQNWRKLGLRAANLQRLGNPGAVRQMQKLLLEKSLLSSN